MLYKKIKFQNLLLFFTLFLLLSIIILRSSLVVYAQDSLEDIQEKIKEYSQKVSQLNSKVGTLKSDLEYMSAQINLTEFRIKDSETNIIKTQDKIFKLTKEIEDIKNRILKLSDSIIYQKELLNNRIRERYKIKDISPFLAFFGSSTFNELIKKTEYLEQIEVQDNKLLEEMQKTKYSYDNQKNIFEDKRIEEEKLKEQLVNEKANLDSYKSLLDNQRYEKQKLLEITKNDESKYSKLLQEAQEELEQISGAVSVLKNTSGEKVKKGDLIGYQGNTGYSVGEHLHFGVYKYSSFDEIDGWSWYYSNYIDPKNVLQRKSIYWNTGCESPGYKETGKGDWIWPINNPIISQGFGTTCWSNRLYNGKPHPAYDMYGKYSEPIYAVEDGRAHFCRNCLNDGGNGVFIFHDNGYMTLYWHLK